MDAHEFCIKSKTLWDGISDNVIQGGCVYIQNGKIAACGTLAELTLPENVEEIDFKDATIMPGLIDGHTHLNMVGDGWEAAEYIGNKSNKLLFATGLDNLERAICGGVTTLFDDGGKSGSTTPIRDFAAKEGSLLPEVWASDIAVQPRAKLDRCMGNFVDADDPKACAAKVEELKKKYDIDWLKIYLTPGGTSGSGNGDVNFGPKALKALVDTAHSLGIKAGAHCTNIPGMVAMMDAGGDCIIHGEFVDSNFVTKYDPQVAKRIADSGIWYNSTIFIAQSRIDAFRVKEIQAPLSAEQEAIIVRATNYLNGRYEVFHTLWEMGIPIMAGSDTGWSYYRFGDFYKELVTYSAKCGLSPIDALKTGTSNIARYMGNENIGSLAVGVQADIAVFRGDVTRDIGNLAHTLAVYKRGLRAV